MASETKKVLSNAKPPGGVETEHLVRNEDDVRTFAKLVLETFRPDNDYRAILFPIARRKYFSSLYKGSLKLPRTVISSSSVDDFVASMQAIVPGRLSMKTTADGKEEVPIPSCAVGIYCTLDPRSATLAQIEMTYEQDKLTYLASQFASGDKEGHELKSEKPGHKPYSKERIFKTWLHKTVAKNLFLDIDFDVYAKDVESRRKVWNFFEEEKLWPFLVMTLATRGGYHLLLKSKGLLDPARKRLMSFAGTCKKEVLVAETSDKFVGTKPGDKKKSTVLLQWFTVNKKSQVPIPGTLQGGHLVTMIDFRTEMSKLFVK